MLSDKLIDVLNIIQNNITVSLSPVLISADNIFFACETCDGSCSGDCQGSCQYYCTSYDENSYEEE